MRLSPAAAADRATRKAVRHLLASAVLSLPERATSPHGRASLRGWDEEAAVEEVELVVAGLGDGGVVGGV